MPGACTLDAAMKLAAASSSNSASSTLPASSQPQRPPDPFTAAADRSFDAPWLTPFHPFPFHEALFVQT